MKCKNDLMYVDERRNRFNELSFVLRCSGKDPLTRKPKVYVKTFKVPSELKGKKEIEAFRMQIQVEWKSEVAKLSANAIAPNGKILFIDFARRYVEHIIVADPQAYNHYVTCKSHLKILEDKLGAYKLSELTPQIIQNFYDWLGVRTYKKSKVTVKASLRGFIGSKGISLRSVAEACQIAHTTLFAALKVGRNTSKETVLKICNYLKVPFSNYFTIIEQESLYSWSANNGVKVFVHGVLHEAVRQGLIEHNYASSEYIRPVSGKKGRREILESKEELAQFVKCIMQEPDIRKRVAFSLYIYLGLRNAEVAGLSWDNINFSKNLIHIEKNTLFVRGFGTVTKSTKSANSNRVIGIPSGLAQLLAEYKAWWNNEKVNHGDLWANTNKLFVQNNGNDMNGTTLAHWLREWEEKNGLKKVTPHGLRHTNITMQIANGVDIKTVSARAGHNDIQTTLNIYSHYSAEADKKATDTIDKLLKI